MVMSTPIAIKNMDCSTCKAFEPIENMYGVHAGTCHRRAPIITSGSTTACFPTVNLPEWCIEYIAKD